MRSLCVIIPTYKTRQLLKQCLAATFQELNHVPGQHHVIVIDNASHDGTVEMVRAEYPAVILIANDENVGPGCAFNQGLEKAMELNADYILVANSDAEPTEGSILGLLEYLESHPDMAGVTPRLLNTDGSLQYQRLYVSGGSRKLQENMEPLAIDFVGTTFALIRADAYRKLGGYDERYFFYNEDLDWSTRAKRAGLRFMWLPQLRVVHHLSKGSSQNRGPIIQALYASNIYYFRRHYGWLAYLVYLALCLELLIRWVRAKRGRDPSATANDYAIAFRRMSKTVLRMPSPEIPTF